MILRFTKQQIVEGEKGVEEKLPLTIWIVLRRLQRAAKHEISATVSFEVLLSVAEEILKCKESPAYLREVISQHELFAKRNTKDTSQPIRKEFPFS